MDEGEQPVDLTGSELAALMHAYARLATEAKAQRLVLAQALALVGLVHGHEPADFAALLERHFMAHLPDRNDQDRELRAAVRLLLQAVKNAKNLH